MGLCACGRSFVSSVCVCVCQVIIMGATNRPQDLDSAILRRMPTRFHINQPVRIPRLRRVRWTGTGSDCVCSCRARSSGRRSWS